MMNYDDRPIIACSSGNVRCAISIIRISGKNYLGELDRFFSVKLAEIKPKQAIFCEIKHNEKILDEAVLTYFKGPNSYNGEDILEISVHGNPINVNRIIDLFLESNILRKANPGEFSLRALNNKKLSLTQVEGLDLLLNANSVFSLDQGFSALSGNLKDKFIELYNAFLEHRSSLELGFDFLEDVGEEQFNKKFSESFSRLKESIDDLYKHHKKSPYNLIKPKIALVGQPNAGKSSLFNNLLGSNRSIVSTIAGTTRDFVSEDLYISNSLYTLVDTAGVRETEDVIEKEGVARSLEILKDSFFKILLVDPKDFNSDYFKNFCDEDFDLIIFTHSDDANFNENLKTNGLQTLKAIGPIEPVDFGPIEPVGFGPIEPADFGPIEPADFGPIEPLFKKSFKTNLLRGDSNLPSFIFDLVSDKYMNLIDFDPILIERHNESIKNIYKAFRTYEDTIKNIDDISVIGSELNIVGHCVSELIGIISPDNVLHNIFDNFCIGK